MDSSLLTALALAVPLFALTNVDDIFVLLGFFADKRFRTAEVLIGQFAGIFLLIAVSVVAAMIALVLPPQYIGLLGLAPIAIGLTKVINLLTMSADKPDELKARGFGIGNIISVLVVTVANGGDNIGVYAPVFALRTPLEIAAIIVVFVVMTAVWCLVAYWMVNHPKVGAPIRRFSHVIVPFVLIAIGLFVLYEAGTFKLLAF